VPCERRGVSVYCSAVMRGNGLTHESEKGLTVWSIKYDSLSEKTSLWLIWTEPQCLLVSPFKRGI